MVDIYYRVTECNKLMNLFTFAFQQKAAFDNIALFTLKSIKYHIEHRTYTDKNIYRYTMLS